MSDPTRPQDFVNTIKSILKRLANLEGRGIGNSLTVHTTAEQNGINVVNSTDTEVARFGVLQRQNSNPVLNFESDGVAIFNSSASNATSLWVDFDIGMMYPNIPFTWEQSNAAVTVTSGTFADIFNSWIYALPSKWVQAMTVVGTDVGTTAEVRMQWQGVNQGTTQTVGSGVTSNLLFKKVLSSPTPVIAGGPTLFGLQVRRASGAGNVYVYQPRSLAFGLIGAMPVSGWEVT
jgi:hypothetical protein